MNVIETAIPGLLEIVPAAHVDERGSFVKTFHRERFESLGLRTDFVEEYYTRSRARVLRGLHFQLPPHGHVKLVTCVHGRVLDAVLDLRAGSPTFGRHVLFALSARRPSLVYIPEGLAHGFFVPGSGAVLLYKVTSLHAPAHDAGILWNSAGIPWPDPDPIISDRDRSFPPLDGFVSPFRLAPRHA